MPDASGSAVHSTMEFGDEPRDGDARHDGLIREEPRTTAQHIEFARNARNFGMLMRVCRDEAMDVEQIVSLMFSQKRNGLN